MTNNIQSFAGIVDINGTTDSTSTSTGALQVGGGAGIASNLHVGGTGTFSGDVEIHGSLNVGGTPVIQTVAVGEVNTGQPGSVASVQASTDDTTTTFNFTIPRGDKGNPGNSGAAGDDGEDGVTPVIQVNPNTVTEAAGGNASVEASTQGAVTTFTFTIPRGDTGNSGNNGDDGADGEDGVTPVIQVNPNTVTEAAGGNASVEASTQGAVTTFTFTIPRGDTGNSGNNGDDGADGEDGVTPVIQVNPNTVTEAAGGNASVEASTQGTTTTFTFTIPRGDTGNSGNNGDDGADGEDGVTPVISVGTTTTGSAGGNASVTALTSFGSPDRTLNFTIPRGAKGDKGDPGDIADLSPAYIGPLSTNNDNIVVFNNSFNEDFDSYALLQTAMGETFVNSVEDSLHLRYGNVEKMTINGAGVNVIGNFTVNGAAVGGGGSVEIPRIYPPVPFPYDLVVNETVGNYTISGRAYGNGSYRLEISSVLTYGYPDHDVDVVMDEGNNINHGNTSALHIPQGTNTWITFKLPVAIKLMMYKLTTRNYDDTPTDGYIGAMARDWDIEGLNDSTEAWEIIDRRRDEKFYKAETREFYINENFYVGKLEQDPPPEVQGNYVQWFPQIKYSQFRFWNHRNLNTSAWFILKEWSLWGVE